MGTLAIDLETYSEEDIRRAGLYKYAENCEIILFAYAFDDGPVKIVDMLQGETLPAEVLEGLKDGSTLKTAYNAAFEMNVIEKTLGIECDPKYWECTMVQGYMLGLPGGLDLVGKILKLSEDKAKMAEGKRLIRYFSVPCRPSKANGGRTRNLPEHDPDKWNLFKEYCKRDVEAEREIRHKLGYLLSDGEHSRVYAPDWNLWELDQRINRAGVLIDTALVDKAVEVDGMAKEALMREARELTGLANPGSRAQCLDWLGREGLEVETFDKTARKELLKDKTLPKNVRRFIEIKDLLGKTSVKKYVSMKNAMCRDGRVRGMLQFYGASRTGRWAGRLVQLHNLPQNHMEDLDEVRAILKNCDFETIDFLRDNVADDLSQLIRTAFIAGGGRRFIVADFAAIEARVIAWLAGETWRQEAFKNGEDIYCASASQMFGVPVVKHGINGELRQKGKVAELACIAEGQEVLTNVGLVPIEEITTCMKLWDGENWVTHEGVIYKGEREVIEYEGLRATADHPVWVEGEQGAIQFGIASTCGAHLIKTGDGGTAIRLGENNRSGKKMEQKPQPLLCSDRMHGLWRRAMAGFGEFKNRQIKRLSAVLTATTDTPVARQTAHGCKTTLRESKGQGLSELWWPWDRIQVRECYGGGAVPYRNLWNTRQEEGDRQNRYGWALRPGESALGNAPYKLHKPETEYSVGVLPRILALCKDRCSEETEGRSDTGRDYTGGKKGGTGKAEKLEGNRKKVRVYDIRNAGPNHRFTVSGKLVHNCGYGGGVNALKAFGADRMGLSDDDMAKIVRGWRNASPNVVGLWGKLENAAKSALRTKGQEYRANDKLSYCYWRGVLTAKLPSGRSINYVRPSIKVEEVNGREKESLEYYGTSTAGGWSRCFTWGGKLTENAVQAIARDCLAEAMMNLDRAGYKIVMHVHDEVILEMPYGKGSLEEAAEIMGRPIGWADGLLLRADGYETEYYRKD